MLYIKRAPRENKCRLCKSGATMRFFKKNQGPMKYLDICKKCLKEIMWDETTVKQD